ncbi:MAG: hypothetical protein FJ313_00775 [Gemmatimonadetes bacterium]|nr:hypothetical protein [Gemmatimonadota bacterium]
MPTASTELPLEAFRSAGPLAVAQAHLPAIQVELVSAPPVEFPFQEAVGTPNPRKRAPLTIVPLPRNYEVMGWRLRDVLMVQERRTRSGVVATAYLEAFTEYGAAKGEAEALADLICSLGEYRESLARRREKLSPAALGQLGALDRLIERVAGS